MTLKVTKSTRRETHTGTGYTAGSWFDAGDTTKMTGNTYTATIIRTDIKRGASAGDQGSGTATAATTLAPAPTGRGAAGGWMGGGSEERGITE